MFCFDVQTETWKILSKIISSGALTSLASDAGKYLFGKGFETRIKTRSETAKTLVQAAQVGQRSSHKLYGNFARYGYEASSYACKSPV